MTSSSPVRPDPLAPAKSTAQPAAKGAVPVAPTAEKKESPPEKKKRSSGLLLILGGVFLLLLLAGGGAAVLFLLPKGAPPTVTAAPPVPPDPGVPPPLPEFKLEEFVPEKSAKKLPDQSELIKAAGARLPARFIVGSGETVAPKEFVVRGGGLNDVAGTEIPHHERWTIQFPPGTTIESYTRQLDFFKIELGVIGGSQNVTYLTNLSNPKPQTRQAPGNTETRLYLIWNSGPMQEADEILVGRAGLNADGKVLAHFVPAAVEAEMLRLEADQAKTNNLSTLRRTVFGIQANGEAFRMVVLEQKGD
jgi:hypothetical protein